MEKFKKILYLFLVIFGAVVIMVLIGFSVFNLYKTLSSGWGFGGGSSTPYFSASCQKFKNDYELTVSLNNYNKEIKNIVCQLVSNGGMTVDRDKIEIPLISPNSADICAFVLTGEPSRSINIRITYTQKGIFKNKNFSTIAMPYPDCSVAAIDESLLKY